MLTLQVLMSDELYDEKTHTFIEPEVFSLELEHSLASLSKWESREEIPFLGKEEKTSKQILDYVRDMIVTPDAPSAVFDKLSPKNLSDINDYINAKMSATWINELEPSRSNQQIITAEVIYFWMISLQIPFECQHWHLNRLITLVRVCNEKNKPQKKMNRQAALERQRQLNASRRSKHGTRG